MPATGGVKLCHLQPLVLLGIAGGEIYSVELYLRVRLESQFKGLSQSKTMNQFGIARKTVRNVLRHSKVWLLPTKRR